MTAPEHCEDCGDECPTWYADDDRWNYVTAHMPRGRGSILCPSCFCTRWTTVTGLTARWHLTPEHTRPVGAVVPDAAAFTVVDETTTVETTTTVDYEMTPPRAEPPVFFRGRILDTGGGMCTVAVDRDTERYLRVGARVVVDELAS